MKKILIQNENINYRTLSEIKILNKFSSNANIIKILDYCEKKNEYNLKVMYILFPLMKRGTLRDKLNLRLTNDPERENLNLTEIIDGFKIICSVFNYMHTHSPVRYVHQDIKPEVSGSQVLI